MRRVQVILALSLCVAGCGSELPAAQGARATTTIEIVDFPGLEAALESRRGEPTLLNFWAMWCAPCVAELPELVHVGQAYADEGGRILGVSYDLMVSGADPGTIESTLRTFLAGGELELSTLVYDDVDYEAINERFGLPGEIPVTLAVDASGAIVDRQHGKAGRERFEEMMRKALGL